MSALVLFPAIGLVGCGAGSAADEHTRAVIDDLVARDYAQADGRYRMFEADVLSPGAAPAWRRVAEHADATVREWAIDALSRIGLPEDTAVVRGRLDDPVRGVRTAAAKGVIRMDRDTAIAEFTQRIASSSPEQVTLAAGGFVEMEYREASPLLLERFTDVSLPESTRAALTQPLAALGDADAVEALVVVALDPTADVSLRRLAAESAVAVETEEPVAALQNLRNADDEYIRELAGMMLEEG